MTEMNIYLAVRSVYGLGTPKQERSKGVNAQGQTVGRTKSFAKVLVPRNDSLLGRSAIVRISSTCRLHVEGLVVGDVR